jgi:cyclopropane fatty-acyl-phospholipid synthase-like methyltransferase
MADRDTLCGWGDSRKIAYFVENHQVIVPRRSEQLTMVADLLPWSGERAISVLDLGAGFGALAEIVLHRFPHAAVTCVDGSTVSVELARQRLAKYGAKVRIFQRDLADAAWREGIGGPFDCAVSALAIHHLGDARKLALYREVYELLAGAGIFLNDEIVALPAALKECCETLGLRVIQEQERAQRKRERTIAEIQREIREQMGLGAEAHQSSIAPLRDQLRWLDEAGFKSVDCYWKYLDFAIFGGVKN